MHSVCNATSKESICRLWDFFLIEGPCLLIEQSLCCSWNLQHCISLLFIAHFAAHMLKKICYTIGQPWPSWSSWKGAPFAATCLNCRDFPSSKGWAPKVWSSPSFRGLSRIRWAGSRAESPHRRCSRGHPWSIQADNDMARYHLHPIGFCQILGFHLKIQVALIIDSSSGSNVKWGIQTRWHHNLAMHLAGFYWVILVP